MSRYCLGALAPKPVPLGDFAHYFLEPLPEPLAELVAPQLHWPMAGNDRYGDCTIAGALHADQATASLVSEPWTYPGDNTVVSEYLGLGNGADKGLAVTDVLRAWTTDGLFGKQLVAFAPLHPRFTQTMKQAVALGGAVYCAVALPKLAQNQFAAHVPWDLTRTLEDDDIEGGHCIILVGYNRLGPVFVTWGALQQATWRWWASYGTEAYALVTAEVKDAGGLRGVDLPRLEQDVQRLGRA